MAVKYNFSMIRGDSECLRVSCDNGFQEGDVVAMQVRENASDDEALLTRIVDTFDDGKALINILPEDTAEVEPGKYKYDIEVRWSTGLRKTIIEKSDFVLREDVTRIADEP